MTEYKPRITRASELIEQLEKAIQAHGDLPVDLSVDWDGYDDTYMARGPLDYEVECCRADDWAEEIHPKRFLIRSTGFLTNLACIPE